MAAIVLAAAASSAATAAGWSAFAVSMASGAAGFLGGFVDRAIFGGSRARINQEGPRVTDLMVQYSTYGKAIPIVYGNARIAGNVIWSRPIQEHITTSTQTSGGGKGGGGGGEVTTTTTSYSYSISLAVAICEGPITEVVRVWADSKPLDFTQGSYSLYLGTEDQLPDTYMSSFHAPGMTPAYRGMAYVVIKDFPLADFGNRVPNFTFEVRRTLKKPGDLEDKITAVSIIPGAGEYVYDTVVQEKQYGQQDVAGNFVQGGKVIKLNQNNLSNKADVLVALDNLKATLPNVQWVSVIINWFANSLDPATMTIKPASEFNSQGARVAPNDWSVAGYNRNTAHQILYFGDGSPTFGGTPTDLSVLRLCQELKARGYKVLLYPMLQVDTITPTAKPWRGRIIPTSASAANAFFTNTLGYNAFITHYANLNIGGTLLRSYLDGFMIGSELVGLTTYMSSSGVFPAVTQLKSLAATIKGIVGSGIKVIYGADWSEYHSTNGWYHLDPLWSDANIDAIGIDWYAPLTPDLPQSQIDYNAVYGGWTSGEGWNYFYSDPVNRTGLTNYGSPTYAWKNFPHWYNNTHTNPGGGATAWVPNSKPLWFTELGFPSVDGAANQPNLFYDPDSVEGAFPRGSRGRVDFLAQRTALEASIDYINNLRVTYPNLVVQAFIWTWDARPYPFWPDRVSVWADAGNWKYGHWLQGKLGLSGLGLIVADLLKRVGYDVTMYDTTRLVDIVSGFVISNRQVVRACLEQLAAAYFFDQTESDALLKYVKRGKVSNVTIDYTELVPQGDGKETLTVTRTQELELPRQVDVIYLNRTADFQAGTQTAQRQTVKAVDYTTVNLPIVLSDQEAKVVADVTLYNAWVGRVQFTFAVPPKHALLEPTDVITVTKDGAAYLARITGTKLARSGMQDITAVAEDVSSYDFYNPAGSAPPTIQPPVSVSATRLELMDLPAFPTDGVTDAYLRYGVVGLGADWTGAAVYRSDDGGANYTLLQSLSAQATIGAGLTILPNGNRYSWDNNTVDVLLTFGELQSVTEIAVLNGANACVIGDEILQFQNAQLIGDHQYRLSRLLRGRLGTEWAMAGHVAGERFVQLTNTVARELVASSAWGIGKKYKPVTIGSTLGAATAQDFTYNARALKPYAPVHVVGIRDGTGNLTIGWKRRTRIGGDWRDAVDIPLSEESERYEVEIFQGATLKRTITGLTAPSTSYSAAQQVTDFGSAQASVSVKIYQLSAAVGRGYASAALV